MKNIVIVGTGGFAREIKFLIDEINKKYKVWNFIGYISNDDMLAIGDDNWLLAYNQQLYCAIALGNPSLIKKLFFKFKVNENLIFPNLVHPNVIWDEDSILIGEGNLICAGNILTCNIRIGSFNVFNLSCTIGHDTIIGSFNVINPQTIISGGVTLIDENLIGTGAIILQYLKISSNIIIGAGALINKDITDAGVYLGLPAKAVNK